MEGTGYGENHQVKTKFGKWPISYDPVTVTANAGVTEGYHFPAEEGGAMGAVAVDFGGLVDVSMSAPGHSTMGEAEENEEKAADLAPSTSFPFQGVDSSE